MAKLWSRRNLEDVAGQVALLTKRVYLLECEAGTQSGRDIRPVSSSPNGRTQRSNAGRPRMSRRRVDIKAILADEDLRRDLMVSTIQATQAREGIETTKDEADRAYCVVTGRQREYVKWDQALKLRTVEHFNSVMKIRHLEAKNKCQEKIIRNQKEKIMSLQISLKDKEACCGQPPCSHCHDELPIPGAVHFGYRRRACGHGWVLA